jgi:hypothetical protein
MECLCSSKRHSLHLLIQFLTSTTRRHGGVAVLLQKASLHLLIQFLTSTTRRHDGVTVPLQKALPLSLNPIPHLQPLAGMVERLCSAYGTPLVPSVPSTTCPQAQQKDAMAGFATPVKRKPSQGESLPHSGAHLYSGK